ncbi:MAG: sigma-70 family RNA polymerase sigma factor [Candidatus Iainarchaeum archaeon]|uniref:Sigma-70 family RNA polymerase sigma factor n=1 Tax=Candidatus Iainarchaeum sp. TaxID=3101447 RepID=A0A7T9DJ52_9ARCH|nr:MAG: sigma-70 family RNA polymerase sigma factor [Candidatus Diapherotrites archaeon]
MMAPSSIPAWIKRRLDKLTPRQRKYFLKQGLMPLTPVTRIAERAGVLESSARDILQGLSPIRANASKRNAALYAFYQEAIRNPNRSWVLDLPRFWYLHRMVTLAPSHGVAEIHALLQLESNGRPVPSRHIISAFIRANNLNTANDRLAAGRRYQSVISRKRKPNALPEDLRWSLLFDVYKLLPQIMRGHSGFFKEELIDAVYERLENEVNYFDPEKMNGDLPVKEKWEKYVRKRIRYFVIDAMRQKSGRGKKKPKRDSIPVEEIPSRSVGENPQPHSWNPLLRVTPPNSMEWKVVRLLSVGFSRSEVAQRLGIARETVYSHLSHAKARLKKGGR